MYCKNCKSYLQYDNDFCGSCGAKIVGNRLTIKGIFREVKEEYLVHDNKLFLTFWHLLVKPEIVIQGYIDGIRKRYLNVIAYVTVSLTILGVYVFLVKNFYIDETLTEGFNSGLLGGKSVEELTPEQKKKFIETSKQFSDLMGKFFDYLGLITIVTTPINALASYLVFIAKRKHNYAEHVVINYYMAAQASITQTLILILTLPLWGNSPIIAATVAFLAIVYQGYVLKRIYNISIFESFYKTIFFFIIQSTIVFFLILLFTIIGIGIYFLVFK